MIVQYRHDDVKDVCICIKGEYKRCNNKNVIYAFLHACLHLYFSAKLYRPCIAKNQFKKFMALRMTLHYFFFRSLQQREYAIENMQKSGAILEISTTLERWYPYRYIQNHKCRCRKLSK